MCRPNSLYFLNKTQWLPHSFIYSFSFINHFNVFITLAIYNYHFENAMPTTVNLISNVLLIVSTHLVLWCHGIPIFGNLKIGFYFINLMVFSLFWYTDDHNVLSFYPFKISQFSGLHSICSWRESIKRRPKLRDNKWQL